MKENNLNQEYSSFRNDNFQSYIPQEEMTMSLNNYDRNTFTQFLIILFGRKIAKDLIKKYFIGTPQDPHFSTVFWQIDKYGNIRTGKALKYEILDNKASFTETDCKIAKDAFPFYHWLHIPHKEDGFLLKQCFFGEHLLNDETKPVAIVEGEKTAVVASKYYPEFIWLATGGVDFLTVKKCNVLQGRKIVLLPRISDYDYWKALTIELSRSIPSANFVTYDIKLLRMSYSMIEDDFDLADCLIKRGWTEADRK